jgi:7-cyano-7-deazaguanine synthase
LLASSAIVLLSGGLDSTVALWWARDKDYRELSCLTFEYGSSEEPVSLECSRRIAEAAGLTHRTMEVEALRRMCEKGYALIGGEEEIPDDPDIDPHESTRKVWVPGRNLLFIALTASLAETLGEDSDIIVGFDEEEARTFPDNSARFVENVNSVLVDAVMETRVKVVAPLLQLDKAGIVRLGSELGAPLEMSCSCYRPATLRGGVPVHCGTCPSCRLRRGAFVDSRIADPTVYEAGS